MRPSRVSKRWSAPGITWPRVPTGSSWWDEEGQLEGQCKGTIEWLDGLFPTGKWAIVAHFVERGSISIRSRGGTLNGEHRPGVARPRPGRGPSGPTVASFWFAGRRKHTSCATPFHCDR